MSFSPQAFFGEIQGERFDDLDALEERIKREFFIHRDDFPNHYSLSLFLDWIYRNRLVVQDENQYRIDIHSLFGRRESANRTHAAQVRT